MTDRACSTCGSRMGPGEIRQRDPRSGELVCPTCLNHPMTTPNRTNVNIVTTARNILRKVAHDGGDGQVVAHCFSCGSGGVVGRSDGTVECSFCGVVFSIQVQPRNPHAPQTVNGQPVHIPGMPEESEVTPSTGDETVDAEVVDGPEEPSEEFRVPGIEDADLTDYMTATGHRLSRKHYVQHLALSVAPLAQRQKVASLIRQANLPTAFCMRCHEEDLPPSWLCRRPGEPFIDHGQDYDPDLARYEGICQRCCEHNHG